LRLVLVGTGNDANELSTRIKELGLEGVTWNNEFVLERSVLRTYLSSADVYAFPSNHEGFPVAPIEAMACGLPVVATDASGIPDILEEGEDSGGIVVPRGDVNAFAAALGRMLDADEWRDKLSRRARQRVETRFSLDAVGAQLRQFFIEQGMKSSLPYDDT
jgi:glycosyltransferase involved in cell wall biosynthesis